MCCARPSPPRAHSSNRKGAAGIVLCTWFLHVLHMNNQGPCHANSTHARHHDAVSNGRPSMGAYPDVHEAILTQCSHVARNAPARHHDAVANGQPSKSACPNVNDAVLTHCSPGARNARACSHPVNASGQVQMGACPHVNHAA
eukprot:1160016-Pelagomonas_calceolata.AAC.1